MVLFASGVVRRRRAASCGVRQVDGDRRLLPAQDGFGDYGVDGVGPAVIVLSFPPVIVVYFSRRWRRPPVIVLYFPPSGVDGVGRRRWRRAASRR